MRTFTAGLAGLLLVLASPLHAVTVLPATFEELVQESVTVVRGRVSAVDGRWTADRRTMTAVASRIRRKIDWTAEPEESDGDFLAAYYAALRGRLEQRLLFGHRRRDKHDKV